MSRGSQDVDASRRARYEALFREAYEPVQRYVRRRPPADVVDDVVADTMMVVWRRVDDVPADGLATAWCIGVARRCLANQRRGSARHERLVERVTAAVPHEPSADPTAAAAEVASDTALQAALAHLPADDQELLRLWAWDGLAPREIATVMGLSANAVSIRLHRVKQRLAETLAQPGSAGGHTGGHPGGHSGGKNPEAAGHSTGGRTEEAR